MKFDVWLKGEVTRGRQKILAASMDYEKARSMAWFMRANNYAPDGSIRQSSITGDWYQWWYLIEEPVRLNPSCVKCKGTMVKAGFSRGVQRWECRPCDVRALSIYKSAPCPPRSGFTRKPEEAKRVVELLLQGESVRGCADILGVSKRFVQLTKQREIGTQPILCRCGQRAGHKGWCGVRVARSLARQEFLKRWGVASFLASSEIENRGTVPVFCVGRLSRRTAIAIKRAAMRIEGEWRPLQTDDEYIALMNAMWRANRILGCIRCEHVSKHGASRRCRRCVHLDTVLRDIDFDMATSVSAVFADAREEVNRFARSLSQKRGLRPAQRLHMLLEKVSGTRNIQAEG